MRGHERPGPAVVDGELAHLPPDLAADQHRVTSTTAVGRGGDDGAISSGCAEPSDGVGPDPGLVGQGHDRGVDLWAQCGQSGSQRGAKTGGPGVVVDDLGVVDLEGYRPGHHDHRLARSIAEYPYGAVHKALPVELDHSLGPAEPSSLPRGQDHTRHTHRHPLAPAKATFTSVRPWVRIGKWRRACGATTPGIRIIVVDSSRIPWRIDHNRSGWGIRRVGP